MPPLILLILNASEPLVSVVIIGIINPLVPDVIEFFEVLTDSNEEIWECNK